MIAGTGKLKKHGCVENLHIALTIALFESALGVQKLNKPELLFSIRNSIARL